MTGHTLVDVFNALILFSYSFTALPYGIASAHELVPGSPVPRLPFSLALIVQLVYVISVGR